VTKIIIERGAATGIVYAHRSQPRRIVGEPRNGVLLHGLLVQGGAIPGTHGARAANPAAGLFLLTGISLVDSGIPGLGSCRSWGPLTCVLILVQTFDSLSSAMRSTTFLTTIRVCPLESAKVQNPYLQGEIGRARTVADTLPMPYKQGVRGSSPLGSTSHPWLHP